MRPSGRASDQMRDVTIERGIAPQAEGSCLVSFGRTRVLCTASVETSLPPWRRGQGLGWVTAEYGMLPRATGSRTRREATAGKQSGRTQEIQRLIGRSLRAVIDMAALGENQVILDCDVLEADGGTRTASITGAFVALSEAIFWMKERSLLKGDPIRDHVAAVSCGVYRGTPVLDLDYLEDSEAETDANFVLTGSGKFVEIQGTAEAEPFSSEELAELIGLAQKGISELVALQRAVLGAA
ncbi:ribonuclease PH [Pelagibacterium halotolerans]|uniref:Ribonuclease PH n=1 Tax=Pelagibacterium halotolerans (strain DSM 22347 / JCM 15775 / CGMCC 1.7692 / B2) TaxID=1082931 RepID=G4R7U4_PELHB|nr:ribonuclease PH [Pelagibacterium halotolerans]AEQ53354.1 ribonuclease PH [Pelagibacterium halotolerans B2]QJR17034.1 ribonuclease PH [Pelagibacterium halotolerans]SEA62315.1 RNAse PH [Pelagibacterium halotolerans]